MTKFAVLLAMVFLFTDGQLDEQPAGVYQYNRPFATYRDCEAFRKSDQFAGTVYQLAEWLEERLDGMPYEIVTECQVVEGRSAGE